MEMRVDSLRSACIEEVTLGTLAYLTLDGNSALLELLLIVVD